MKQRDGEEDVLAAFSNLEGGGTRVSFCNSNYSVLHPLFYEFTSSLWGCLTLAKFTRDCFIAGVIALGV